MATLNKLLIISCLLSTQSLLAQAQEVYWPLSKPYRQKSSSIDSVKAEQKVVIDEGLRIVTKLIEIFPPDSHQYIGIGRSPSLLTAILKASDIPALTQTLNVPMSNIASWGNSNKVVLRYYDRISKDTVNQIAEKHLDLFLAKNLNGKPIVLIDHSNTGHSLEAAKELFRAYLKKRGLTIPIYTLGLSSRIKYYFYRPKFDQVIFINSAFTWHLYQSNPHEYSAYDKFDPRDSRHKNLLENESEFQEKPSEVRPEYQGLIEHLKALHVGDQIRKLALETGHRLICRSVL